MSRIHEAMKKAEQEQGVTQKGELETMRFDPVGIEPSPETITPTASIRMAMQGPLSTSPNTVFTFDELQARCLHSEWHPDPNVNAFSNPTLSLVGAEQFRTLRSRLYQLRSNRTLRIVLITSSVAGEGKTFVTNNLAHAIVRQHGCRALIVDADLRRPGLHQMLGAPSAPGLTDYLQGRADEFAILQRGHDSNLCFIPSGVKVDNPSELLSNGRLKFLLDRVASAFDWVILDSPPSLPLADASVLAEFCDGVLLVAKAASTPAEVIQRARQELEARKPVIGVVLNAADERAVYYASYEKRPESLDQPETLTQLEA